VLRSALLAVIVALAGTALALADGPYEPNETAATAAGPITTQAVIQAKATQATVCTRNPLTGPGWN
jgi:hypothetical protein